MKVITTLTIVLLSSIINGQVLFNKTYSKSNFDYGDAVIERQDGKYLIAGSSRSQSSTDYDINILLVDSIGNLIWDKFLGQSIRGEFGYSLFETSDNNYLISGRVDGDGADPYLIKFDDSGNLIWEKEYTYPSWQDAYSVGETFDGNYFFVSSDTSTILFKTNSQGDILWTKGYNSVLCHSVIQTSDSGFVLTGVTNPFIGNQDMIIIKTNSIGDTLWTKKYGGDGQDAATSIQQLSDNGYIIAGSFDPQVVDGENETYLVRTNSIGDTIWTQKYYLGASNHIKECKYNNGYILSTIRHETGWFPYPDRYYLVITKLDTLGSIQWSRQFDGSSYSIGNNITQTSDGGFLLTGHNVDANIYADIILIKLDSLGNFVLSVNKISNKENSQISVFPNPANHEINFIVNFNSGNRINQIKIYNLLEQELKTIDNLNETEFKTDLKNYMNGIYFYKITTNDNQTLTGKFMIEK